MSEFSDKRVLITGASRGIGWGIARAFSEEGAKVALIDVNQELLEEKKGEIEKMGGTALALNVDVCDREAVKKAVEKVIEEWGGIDVLVNNAGITRDRLFMRMTDGDWDSVIGVNLTGVYNMTKAVINQMLRQRSGVIVNISSVVGITGNPGQVNYASSKAALIAFTKSLAKEVGSRNIRVMAIAPGFIATEMTEKLSEDVKKAYLERTALRRAGTPEDIANLVLFLSSERASFITGQVYVIDGGMI
ncbi:MAG: 3-oxoacyl-[acyl-carrier-protein] reductase [Candidatus Hydrothermota bacterium]|nr:MAG: 3-oxoacyl-[acyl-carrier-protein] reductase [Candidatus Hydrothermae bacterium]